MQFEIVTLFPEVYHDFFSQGLMGKAVKKKLIEKKIYFIRKYGIGNYKQVDDTVYGGGAGMLIRYDVMCSIMKEVGKNSKKVLLSPRGIKLTQKKVKELSKEKSICFICGSFEGFDQRFIEEYIDEEISIGDYIVNRGEFPSMILMEAISRLQEGFMNKEESFNKESFEHSSLEEDHYTKPFSFNNKTVPELLKEGDHQEIDRWRRKSSLINTFLRRSDLFKKLILDKKDIKMLLDFVYKKK